MIKRKVWAGAFASVLLHTAAAGAADLARRSDVPQAPSFLSGFYVHAGPAGLILGESAKIALGGTRVPGASVEVNPQVTAAAELGYFFTPNLAASFTGGYPPTVDIMGRGTVGSLGRMGSMTYGPATLTAHYHFTGFGAIQPYVGAGPTFMYVFNANDGALNNLKVNNALGFAVQIGADIMLNERWGAFIDVKKAYLRTTATGTLGGVPTKSKVTVDPLVIHTGVTYRF